VDGSQPAGAAEHAAATIQGETRTDTRVAAILREHAALAPQLLADDMARLQLQAGGGGAGHGPIDDSLVWVMGGPAPQLPVPQLAGAGGRAGGPVPQRWRPLASAAVVVHAPQRQRWWCFGGVGE
jgi:hypothetical protein